MYQIRFDANMTLCEKCVSSLVTPNEYLLCQKIATYSWQSHLQVCCKYNISFELLVNGKHYECYCELVWFNEMLGRYKNLSKYYIFKTPRQSLINSTTFFIYYKYFFSANAEYSSVNEAYIIRENDWTFLWQI